MGRLKFSTTPGTTVFAPFVVSTSWAVTLALLPDQTKEASAYQLIP